MILFEFIALKFITLKHDKMNTKLTKCGFINSYERLRMKTEQQRMTDKCVTRKVDPQKCQK